MNTTDTDTILLALKQARYEARKYQDSTIAELEDCPEGSVLHTLAHAAFDMAQDAVDSAQDALTEYQRGDRNRKLRRRHYHGGGEDASYATCGHSH